MQHTERNLGTDRVIVYRRLHCTPIHVHVARARARTQSLSTRSHALSDTERVRTCRSHGRACRRVLSRAIQVLLGWYRARVLMRDSLCWAVLLCCATTTAAALSYRPHNLRVERLEEQDAVGIDTRHPLLSWSWVGSFSAPLLHDATSVPQFSFTGCMVCVVLTGCSR